MPAQPLSAAYNLDDDVRTLAQARKIEADSKRLKAAKQHARKLIERQQAKMAGIGESLGEPPEGE